MATGPSVIVVDTEDHVTNMTPAAHARIEELGGWDNGSLPATVLVTIAAARGTPAPATNRAVGRNGARPGRQSHQVRPAYHGGGVDVR